MKLIWPLVSRIAHWTSERCAICCEPGRLGDLLDGEPLALRGCARSTLPSSTTISGSPSRIGRVAREAVREPGDADLEHGDRPDHEHGAGEGVVVLRQPLLQGVAEDDQQDQVERLQAPELALPDHAREQHHEREDEGCAEDEIHLRETR